MLAPSSIVNFYRAAGVYTWNKIIGATWVRVFLIGSGAGGNAGVNVAAGGTGAAPTGGAGGALVWYDFPASILGLTEIVTIGAGGLGAVFGGGTPAGNNSSFGAWLQALGGLTGVTGARGIFSNTAGNPATGANGAARNATLGNTFAELAAAAGGNGGGITAGVAQVGIAGGSCNGGAGFPGRTAILAGGAAGIVAGAGGNGNSPAADTPMGGSGGGGAGASLVGNGPAGGNGGYPGGGGGCGGNAITGTGNGGPGGNGADGFGMIVTYF